MAARSRLRDRRDFLGLSQKKLASMVKTNVSTVRRWENGERAPRSYQRRPLADALQVPLEPTSDEHGLDWHLTLDGEQLPEHGHEENAGFGATLTQLEHAAVSSGTEGQRQTALRLLGHAYHAAGESAFDRLDLAAAADHFHQVHQIGLDLGDADMITNAQVQLGDVSRRQKRYNAALRLFDTAERHATAASVLTQVRRSQTLARTYAEIGERSSFDRIIGRAEELAERISPEYHREGDHSPRGVRLERGQGLTLLGDPRAALSIYEQSAPPTFRSDRERGSFVIIHAQAIAHAGHLDEGVRLAIRGLELARRYRSPRHVSRVQRMYDRLTDRWPPSEPALIELREALAA